MSWAQLWRLLFQNPIVKAFVLGAFALLGNVLTGAYVSAITVTAGQSTVIAWAKSWQAPSFWSLVVLLIVMTAYGWRVAVHEASTVKALSETRLALAATETALVNERNAGLAAEYRRKVAEEMHSEMLAHFKRRIAEGDVVPMDEIYRIMGIEKGGAL